jgi:uncharacterized membrane protein YbhN (UPF0104 family)
MSAAGLSTIVKDAAGPCPAEARRPGEDPPRMSAPRRAAPQRPVTARRWPGRRILRAAMSAAFVAAAFGLALPHLTSYQSVWASLAMMTWPRTLLVAAAAGASMVAYWVTIRAVLPSVRVRQAAAVSLGSNAVANTLPAGGALAMGVSWAMLSSWGLSAADYVLYTLVAGIWDVFALLGLPITPGGLGITELGLVGILTAGAGHHVSVQVTAAVLLYRAVTYLPPIPLGALACLAWRHAPALISPGSRARRRPPRPALAVGTEAAAP